MGPRRKIYLSLLEKGLSCDEIAKQCGVSKQAVYQSIRRYERKNKPQHEKTYIKGIENQVIFMGVADYLLDHDMSVSGLARKCGISPSCMLKLMSGQTELKKSQIDAIIRATKWPYAKLFTEG